MRTKTLLLTAAVAAAGIASSKAQVYSVNAVGYVNTPLKPGFNLISNPLDNKAGNKIGDLFKNVTPSIPNNLAVYQFVNGGFTTAKYDDLELAFLPATAANASVDPGNGVFVRNPGTTDLTVTFVGEVPQGTLSNPLPAGFSIKASQVPQAGTVTALGYPVASSQQGDKIFKWNNATGSFQSFAYDDLVLDFDPQPSIDVGEAFFLFRKAAGTWNRTFSVNQ